MKLLKRIFYGICILIMLGCGAVLVCALNPELTKSLAVKFAGNEATQHGQAGQAQSGSEIQAPVIEVLPNVQDYEVPSAEDVKVPDRVNGLVGYVEITGQEQQIADEDVYRLQNSLETGSTGEKLSFNTTLYPYYGMLSEDGKKVYQQIYANALELNTSFAPVESINKTELKDVFEAVYGDHPELFWLETTYSCKYMTNGWCLEITLQYNVTETGLEAAKQKFEAGAQAIVDKAEQYTSMESQEKIVHDELMARVSYKKNAAMGQSAYSALVNGESVCAGYARAFQYVMQQLGIPCYYCSGISGENHAWNIVKLGGKYYNVDVTWDDTEPSTYDYYNKSDDAFAKTHVRKGLSVKLPACVGTGASGVLDGADAQINVSGSDAGSSNLSGYINDNPQKPLEWPLEPWSKEEAEQVAKEKEKQENLKKAGVTEEEVLDTMEEYYADCLAQMVKVGVGKKSFSNVVPKSLWPTIEQAYGERTYEKKYVEEGLKKLEKENFAILLQVEDLSGGYYRLYHNISTWTDEKVKDTTDESKENNDSKENEESKETDVSKGDEESKETDASKESEESKESGASK